MDIEEMKALWSDMSDQLDQQKKLTNDIIIKMTQEKYSNKFRTLANYETFGAIVCFAILIFLLLNFHKLDTWYLLTCGIITMAFMIIFPVLTLRYLRKIKQFDIINKNYKEVLVGFHKAKTNLLNLQKAGVFASFIVIFTSAAVFAKIFNDKDFFMIERGVKEYVFLAFTLVFVFFFSRWGYKAYQRIANSAESVLKELE